LEFTQKNIIAIPNFLTQTFIQLNLTDPFTIAKAFISAIFDCDDSFNEFEHDDNTTKEIPEQEILENQKDLTYEEDSSDHLVDQSAKIQLHYKKSTTNISAQENLLHVVQFCHLCAKGKITPALYSLSSSIEIENWLKSLPIFAVKDIHQNTKGSKDITHDDSNSDESILSPERKISRKDNYLINTMIKLHDTINKSSRNKEEKDPGFTRLELHRKKLILHASAIPPFDTEASSPTEFNLPFLSKKSQLKAKDMLVHRFQINKIAFNPNLTFVTNLWNYEFFWLLSNTPSEVSIFYCQETKSTNAYELERERYLALADKVKATDIEKLSKQKMYLPTTIMDLIWMTQNFHTVISLCFGPDSHSSSFQKIGQTVRIYSPCMSRHEGVNISRGACLMH
jgi:hypothetical protein